MSHLPRVSKAAKGLSRNQRYKGMSVSHGGFHEVEQGYSALLPGMCGDDGTMPGHAGGVDEMGASEVE